MVRAIFTSVEVSPSSDTLANNIAQWNGSSWSALGSGMNSYCVCAGGVGQHVVCGRRFHDGGRQRGQLHRAMEREQLVGAGSGMDEQSAVYALAVSGSTLYAGGDFTTAGGNAANYIAQWNGSSWSALGSGMNSSVWMRWRCRAARCMRAAISRRRAAARPITSRNGTGAVGRRWVRGLNTRCVCAGGVGQHVVCGRRFHDGGRHAANYIAQWNGSSWSALGSGMRQR